MNFEEKIRIFRSRFEGRPDVYGRQHITRREDGKELKNFYPQCENFFSDGCHIKLKDGIACHSCEIQKYKPVSDSVVSKHIRGDEAHIYYLVHDDGTIHFAAIDFDYKEGKEQEGYTFEDVSACSKILKDWGLPHGIARSTGNGFHLYFFFDGPVQAHLFRAVIYELYERVGFGEQCRQGIRPFPEIFPKQAYVGTNGLGNGIKPPMIEPRWPRQRNGFVREDNTWIDDSEQWQYLSSIPRISAEEVDALIAKEQIEVQELPFANASSGRGGNYNPGLGPKKRTGKWQPPLTGSVEKVLEGCAAYRKVKDKCAAGEQPSHHEGMALFHMAMGTADGIDWFKQNVPGWAKDEKDWKQLEYSLQKNYSPYTCRKLQEGGICARGTKCFDPKPPAATVEGRTVVLKDIPRDQWPEPSPIRYAYGTGEDFLLKLQREAEDLRAVEDAEVREDRLKELARRAQVFDENQQKEFKAFVKKLRLVKAADVSKHFNEAQSTHQIKMLENAKLRDDTIAVQGNLYLKLKPHGYSLVKEIREKPKQLVLSSCDIWIEEERRYLDDDRVINTVYVGTATARGIEKKFEIEASKWIETGEFMKYFSVLLGSHFNILRANADFMRQAATAFSAAQGIQHTAYLVTQGWYKDRYLMPSVIIDKEGVRENTEQHVDLGSKEKARCLDFKLLTDEEFREVMMHVKTDFLNAWPRQWTFFGLAHALLPALFKPLAIRRKPALFYEGLTGSGKTQLTHLLQYFWGDFQDIINISGTSAGVMIVAYDFKDALLVVDDYKGADQQQVKALEKAIQYSYDPTEAVKARRDSTLQTPKGARGLFMFSGEEFLSADAAKVARCVIVEVDKQDTRKTRDMYEKSWQMSKDYRGITPRFIHWFLNQDINKLKGTLQYNQEKLYDGIAGRQNADRVSFNLALNYLAWSLWCDFMVASGVCDFKEREELLQEHWGHVLEVRDTMIARCEDEQDATVFIRLLKQLIASGEVAIQGLSGFNPERKPVIGFMPDDKKRFGIAYFHPDLTYNLVKQHGRNVNLRGTERSIARQMVDLGIIQTTNPGRCTKQVRYGETRPRVWEINLIQLGIVRPVLQPVDQSIDSLASDPVVRDGDGVF